MIKNLDQNEKILVGAAVAITTLTYGLAAMPFGIILGVAMKNFINNFSDENKRKRNISIFMMFIAGNGMVSIDGLNKQNSVSNKNNPNQAEAFYTTKNGIVFDKERCIITIPSEGRFSTEDFNLSDEFEKSCGKKEIKIEGAQEKPVGVKPLARN